MNHIFVVHPPFDYFWNINSFTRHDGKGGTRNDGKGGTCSEKKESLFVTEIICYFEKSLSFSKVSICI